MDLLRADLLRGVELALAAVGAPGPLGAAVSERAQALGARVHPLAVDLAEEKPDAPGAADALVWDGAGAFAAAADGVRAVRAALDGAWLAIRAVATHAMAGGGPIVCLAPGPGDPHREAARAGLENLARTLSIEWARRGLRPVAILPGARSTPAEVAELVAFLVSPAGAYYAGCAFTLG